MYSKKVLSLLQLLESKEELTNQEKKKFKKNLKRSNYKIFSIKIMSFISVYSLYLLTILQISKRIQPQIIFILIGITIIVPLLLDRIIDNYINRLILKDLSDFKEKTLRKAIKIKDS